MPTSLLFTLLSLSAPLVHADLPIVHQAYCAGLLNPRAGKVLDSAGISSYYASTPEEAHYVINGRLRRVSLGPQGAFEDPQPEHRLEVPMVNERLPLYTRQFVPMLRNLFQSNFVRRARVLLNDRQAPRLIKSSKRGIPRFTYPVVDGGRVGIDQLRRVSEQLHFEGYGQNRLYAPNAPQVEVAIGGRVFTGLGFYSYRDRVAGAEAETRWQSFARFVAGLSLRHLVRNVMAPAEEKIGYKPRHVFPANAHGELTPELMNDVATELDERTNGADPRTYDVVVGGRAFSGEDFELVRQRMIKDGVVSIDAERGFDLTWGGVGSVFLSQFYTVYGRLLGLTGLALVTVPGVPELSQGRALTMLTTMAALTVSGSVLNYLVDDGEFLSEAPVKRTFRLLSYVLPNYSGIFDSTSFHAVEARRAQALVENVEEAIKRHDANEIMIVTNGLRDVRRIKQAFNLKYDRLLPTDLMPVLGASRSSLRAYPEVRAQVARLNATFARREFTSAEDFVAYFDPRRAEDFAALMGESSGAALFVHYFYQNLRAALPKLRHWNPTPEQEAQLEALAHAFTPYELIQSETGLAHFDFKALRRRDEPSE